jgi:hypothetical protein
MDNFLTLFDMIGVLARRRYQPPNDTFPPWGSIIPKLVY